MSVVKMNKFKDMNMYKIEGEAFKKVQEKHQELSNFLKKMQEEKSKLHTALWDAIEEEIGKKGDKPYCLDTEFEELGFYIVKKSSTSSPFDLFNLLTK